MNRTHELFLNQLAQLMDAYHVNLSIDNDRDTGTNINVQSGGDITTIATVFGAYTQEDITPGDIMELLGAEK